MFIRQVGDSVIPLPGSRGPDQRQGNPDVFAGLRPGLSTLGNRPWRQAWNPVAAAVAGPPAPWGFKAGQRRSAARHAPARIASEHLASASLKGRERADKRMAKRDEDSQPTVINERFLKTF